MASRQEEKERRRQERLEREQAERKSRPRARSASSRRRRGARPRGARRGRRGARRRPRRRRRRDDGGGTGPSDASAAAELPAQKTSDLDEAAKAAGCTVTHPEYEGAGHEEKDFKPADYRTNPPTSGTHFPEWADDGIYAPGNVPQLGMLVHTLEHGRINVQYKPGTPAAEVAQLEALLQEQNEGYHMLLYENPTGMDAAVAATAWTQSLTCPKMNDQVFDAIRSFRARYTDKGPESVP